VCLVLIDRIRGVKVHLQREPLKEIRLAFSIADILFSLLSVAANGISFTVVNRLIADSAKRMFIMSILTNTVVLKSFFSYSPLQTLSIPPQQNHKKDNCKNFTPPTVKKKTIMNQIESFITSVNKSNLSLRTLDIPI